MVLESTYADYLEVLFQDKFGSENVEREVYTPAGRYCDFVIYSKLLTLAVEVENTSEDVIDNGVAQALLYAEELDAAPVCVYPPDTDDNAEELAQLSSHVNIVAIPYEL
jgi:hypothetical protein